MTDLEKVKRSVLERRDSPRVPMKFLVRALEEGGSYDERDGDLAVGGAFFHGRIPPSGELHEVRFHLPGHPKDFRLQAQLLWISYSTAGVGGYHMKFTNVDVNTELAVAKYLDDLARR